MAKTGVDTDQLYNAYILAAMTHLTRAVLETPAIIVYQQPVTLTESLRKRGNNHDEMLKR